MQRIKSNPSSENHISQNVESISLLSIYLCATGVKTETTSNAIKEKMYCFLSVVACSELVFGDAPELTLRGVALCTFHATTAAVL